MAPALSYGIPQDQAAQSGIGSPDLAPATFTNVSSAFDGVFPPYSATLLVLQPEAPKLSVLSSSTELSSFVQLQLEGQSGVAYELQSSPDLTTWTSVSTNLLAENTLILTNGVIPGAAGQFWRARWRPEPDGSGL